MTRWMAALWLFACTTGEPDAPGARPDTPDAPVDTPAETSEPPAPTSLHPGAFALRRLSRDEYDRTVAELFSTTHRFATSFPAEPKTGGFNNVADGLAISPVWFDLADRAAAVLAAEATRPPLPAPIELDVAPAAFVSETVAGNRLEGRSFAMHVNGTAFTTVTLPTEGPFEVTVDVHATHEHSEPLRWSVLVNGSVVYEGEIDNADTVASISLEAPMVAGANVIGVAFDNDYQSVFEDRNLFIDALTVRGPTDWSPTPGPAYARTMVCGLDVGDPRGCARQVLEGLVPRAWRRPVTPDEIDGLLGVYDTVIALGEGPQPALEAAVHATLVSPHFLLLVESPAIAEPAPVSDWELASRLSYFLWGSMPDDALFALAADGTLHEDAALDATVERMLADPRADVLVTSFGAQWLGIDRVASAVPDPTRHGAWGWEVRASMQAEMETFLRTFVTNDRPLVELLTAEEGYVDPVLANFLELPPPPAGMVAYNAAAFNRGGWLTQAGLLTALSEPNRPSPVRRGAWTLGALLCAEPDPPPPGIPALATTDGTASDLRSQLAAHRQNPACASCHDAIDPIGLTMQQFTEVGLYLPVDDAGVIDVSGAMPDGTPVNGVRELQAAIAADPAFLRCATTKAFTWAHHRVPNGDDEAWVDYIRDAMEQDGATLRSLVKVITKAAPFRTRQEAAP